MSMMDIEAFFSHIKDAENGGRELMSILVKDYGVTKDGEQVKQYILENANGVKAVLLNYGAVVSELHVPDKEGKLRDVVWGYEKLEGFGIKPVHRLLAKIADGPLHLQIVRIDFDTK